MCAAGVGVRANNWILSAIAKLRSRNIWNMFRDVEEDMKLTRNETGKCLPVGSENEEERLFRLFVSMDLRY